MPFWKRLPLRTYISKSEKSCPGFKTSKDRLTLLLVGNAEGDFKLRPFLVYHSENPTAFKNVSKGDLPVHWRSNKKAWMTAVLFNDWFENCAVPELKAYCCAENIDFKMLLLLDNAPGHPIYMDDFSENIKVLFMPPNTTSIIQPMDQGAISTFKSYYLRRTFRQLLQATDGHDKVAMKEFWKNYNILMAIRNINLSWKELTKTCLNGVWRELWPECIVKNSAEVEALPMVRKEIASLALEANFEGMEEVDVDEFLESHNEEFQNEDLFALDMLGDDGDSDDEVPEEKLLTSRHISEAMLLISKVLEIFPNNDPDKNRSSKESRAVADATNCHKEIYLEKKSLATQQTLDNFLLKLPQQPDRPADYTVNIESSESE